MRELIGVALACALLGFGVLGRRQYGKACDLQFFMTLIGVAVATAWTLVGTLYPFAYVVISRAQRGGTFIDNLPPGTTEDALYGLFTVGALSLVTLTIVGFNKLLKS